MNQVLFVVVLGEVVVTQILHKTKWIAMAVWSVAVEIVVYTVISSQFGVTMVLFTVQALTDALEPILNLKMVVLCIVVDTTGIVCNIDYISNFGFCLWLVSVSLAFVVCIFFFGVVVFVLDSIYTQL